MYECFKINGNLIIIYLFSISRSLSKCIKYFVCVTLATYSGLLPERFNHKVFSFYPNPFFVCLFMWKIRDVLETFTSLSGAI